MKIILRRIVVVGLLGTVGTGAWYWRTQQDSPDITELVVFGNVDVRQVELAINGSERIAELSVEEGDRIKKGQLLAKLETGLCIGAGSREGLRRHESHCRHRQFSR